MWSALTQMPQRLATRHALIGAAMLVPYLIAASLFAEDGSEGSTPEGFRGSYFVGGQIHVNVYGTSEGQPLTTGHWNP